MPKMSARNFRSVMYAEYCSSAPCFHTRCNDCYDLSSQLEVVRFCSGEPVDLDAYGAWLDSFARNRKAGGEREGSEDEEENEGGDGDSEEIGKGNGKEVDSGGTGMPCKCYRIESYVCTCGQECYCEQCEEESECGCERCQRMRAEQLVEDENDEDGVMDCEETNDGRKRGSVYVDDGDLYGASD